MASTSNFEDVGMLTLFVKVQRRMNKDASRWAATDRGKTDVPDADVHWRVRLPHIFCTACVSVVAIFIT